MQSRSPQPSLEMPKQLFHKLNWCRICGDCLTCCRLQPRNRFNTGTCACDEHVLSHNAKLVKKNRTIDFRYRRISPSENQTMQRLVEVLGSPVRPIEPNLVQANVCGTCQQRTRSAVKGLNEPVSGMPAPADFRRHRSISSCIRQSQSRAAARTVTTASNAPQAPPDHSAQPDDATIPLNAASTLHTIHS
ncbi:hypothetical protein GGH95_005870, partial [Coemansia sp. RSA 1836]